MGLVILKHVGKLLAFTKKSHQRLVYIGNREFVECLHVSPNTTHRTINHFRISNRLVQTSFVPTVALRPTSANKPCLNP
jgi:hypothetical protein